MNLRVEKTDLAGLLLLEPEIFEDARGSLAETYHKEKYRQAGIDRDFVQDNQSTSVKGVLRGLHGQLKHPQAKLVRVLTGEIFDVAVDARPNSPTFGRWHGDELTGTNLKQLFIPEGFLHGFCVLSERAVVHYKCSALYDGADQLGVKWDDPALGIKWPIKNPVVSAKDNQNISWDALKELLKKK